MRKIPLWKEYALDVQMQLGGWRYCTTCTLSVDDSSWGFASVFLHGNEPFTSEVVKEQLETLGYQTLSIRPFQSWGMCWLVHIANPGLRDLPFVRDHVRYFNWIFSAQEFDHVGNIVAVFCVYDAKGQPYQVFVGFSLRNKRWAELLLSRAFNNHESDERFCHITREQAEKLARTLNTELPEEADLITIGKESALPRVEQAREQGRKERQEREQLARDLEGKRQALEHCAKEWDASFSYEVPDLVEHLQLRQSFPLVTGKQDHPSNYTYDNVVKRLGYDKPVMLHSEVIPQIALTLKLELSRLSHRYFVVTPFCLEEGYQVDQDDYDSASRQKKLERIGYRSEEKLAIPNWFPVSPLRLWIEATYHYDDKSAERDIAQHLGLVLTFPDGASYLTLPTRFYYAVVGKEFVYRYSQFVLSEAGPFAELARLPNWFSVNVPPHISLLKAVQAQFLYVPD